MEAQVEQEAEILQLDNFCLSNILSRLDWESLNSVRRSCHRLHSVSMDPMSWNRSVLIKRTVLLLQNAWFGGWFESSKTNFKKYPNCKLSEFMKEGRVLNQNFIVLNAEKLGQVWQRCGPVSGKIFSYLRKCVIERTHEQPNSDWYMQKATLTFRLPKANENDLKIIITQLFTKADLEAVYDMEDENMVALEGNLEYNEAIKLKAYFGSSCIIYKSTDYNEPVTRFSRDYEDVPISDDTECLDLVVKVLQDNLKATNKPLTVEYLILLLKQFACLDYCKFPQAEQLKEIYFTEAQENYQPNMVAIQEWHQELESQLIHGFQEASTRLLQNSPNCKGREVEIKQLIDSLIRISKINVGFDLIDMAYHLSAKVGFDMLLSNEKVVRELLNIVDFTSVSGTWGLQAMQDQQCSCHISLNLCNDKILKVSSTWGTVKLTSINKNFVSFHFHCSPDIDISWETEWNGKSFPPHEVNLLCSVTEILQQTLQFHWQSTDQDVNKPLTNKEVALFFLSVLKGATKVTMQPDVQQDVAKSPFTALSNMNSIHDKLEKL